LSTRFPRKLLGLFAIFLFLSIVFAVLLEAEFSRPDDERVKIMPLGDSITAGTLGTVGYREKLYRDLINSGFKVDFVGSQSAGSGFDADHEGYGWQTASFFNSQLNGPAGYLLNANPPDIILYHIGTNDLGRSNVASYALAANETLRIIYEYDPDITVILAKIILTIDSDRNTRAHSYNLLLEEYAQYWSDNGYSIIVVDMENALIPALYPAGDLADMAHPTTTGYEKMADVWYEALDELLSASGFSEDTNA
jgi:serralysin